MNKSREHARLLIAKAAEDEWMLRRTIDDPAAPMSALGFHAQQAIEKLLKAILTAHSITVPRTHDLAVLLDLLEMNGLGVPPDAFALPNLTPFAVAYRYDEPPEPYPAEVTVERDWLRDCVGRTRAWAESMLLKIAPRISDEERGAP